MNAIESLAGYHRHQFGGSWRLRAVLILAAVAFHIALISLLKFERQIEFQNIGGLPALNLTLVVMPPLPAEQSSGAAERSTVVAAARYTAPTAAIKRAALSAHVVLTGPQPVTTPSARASTGEQQRSEDQASRTDGITDQHFDGQQDIENLERQAVLIAQNRGVTEEMPQDRLIHAPTAKEKFTAAVNKAERKDCRNAYFGLGPLAIPFLVENTITGTGCKW